MRTHGWTKYNGGMRMKGVLLGKTWYTLRVYRTHALWTWSVSVDSQTVAEGISRTLRAAQNATHDKAEAHSLSGPRLY